MVTRHEACSWGDELWYLRAICWGVVRLASWEMVVVAFCKHETSKEERESDKEYSGYAEKNCAVVKVWRDEGDGAQMCNHRHKDEIADDVIVVCRDAATYIEPRRYQHRKARDDLLVAEGE